MTPPRPEANCRDRQREQSERAGHEAGVRHVESGAAAIEGGTAVTGLAKASGIPSRVRDVKRYAGLSRYDAEEPGRREGYSASGWRFGSDSGPDDWSYSESGSIDRGSGSSVGPLGYTEPRARDQRIREEISERLADDPSVDASDISVDVQKGAVTLTGTVTSREQKRRAGDVADCISGVKDVTNDLRISGDDQERSSMRTNGAVHKEPGRSSSRQKSSAGPRPTVGGHSG